MKNEENENLMEYLKRKFMVNWLFGSLSREGKSTSAILVWVGFFILIFFIFIAVFAPYIAPYNPLKPAPGAPSFAPPSLKYPMGTDLLGYDLYSRVIWGSRIPLEVSALSIFFSLIIGMPVGLFSGFIGGKIDRVLVMIMDSIYAFPGLILAIVMTALLGPGLINVAVSIAVVYIPLYFRTVRNHTMSVKQELYVESGRAMGASRFQLIARFIAPNVILTVPVLISLNAADAILTEASLSFLGLGIPPLTPDWGREISDGSYYLQQAPWLAFFPGIFIVLLVVALSLIGEGLNDIVNPLIKRRETL
jgi:peptide/nickel transport system permease protein